MKKTLKALAALLVLALALTACGGSTAGSSAPKNYAEILAAARSNEDNEYYEILAPGENGYTAAQGHADEMSADYIKDYGDMLLELMGFSAEDATDYALSVSMMNVQSYGLAIVKPAEGKTKTVQAGLQAFIDQQKAAQEHYLEDQYAIAKNAKLGVMPGGEVVMVMCEDADTVYANIEKALK